MCLSTSMLSLLTLGPLQRAGGSENGGRISNKNCFRERGPCSNIIYLLYILIYIYVYICVFPLNRKIWRASKEPQIWFQGQLPETFTFAGKILVAYTCCRKFDPLIPFFKKPRALTLIFIMLGAMLAPLFAWFSIEAHLDETSRPKILPCVQGG